MNLGLSCMLVLGEYVHSWLALHALMDSVDVM